MEGTTSLCCIFTGSGCRKFLTYLLIFMLLNTMYFIVWYSALQSFIDPDTNDYGPWWYGMKNRTLLAAANEDPSLPWLFMITPSKKRLVQKADLTRLSQTLQLVKNVHWIIVEDARNISTPVARLLKRSGIRNTHMAVTKASDPKVGLRGRGMVQRNRALQWLRDKYRNDSKPPKGVVYFMDDDNSYDLRLFDFMRQVKGIGVWAVGISGGAYVESPRVKNKTVVGWDVWYGPKRKFATDMAGFAVNLDLILKTDATFHAKCPPGYFETCFLDQFHLKLKDLEPFGLDTAPGELKETYVWHIKTVQPEKAKKKRKGTFEGFEI